MIAYADTSALMKLVRAEDRTPALRRWIDEDRPEVVMSAVGAVELRRAAARVGPDHLERAEEVPASVHVSALTEAVLALAGALAPPGLRTLGAIHLASAVMVADLDAALCHDRRLSAAFERLGIAVEAP